MAREDVSRARRSNTERLLRLPNVVGVGDGYRVKGGERTDQVCLVVLVRRKIPREGLAADHMVPKEIDAVRTDVIEVGDVRALNSRTDRVRPAQPGVSIGHYQVTAGTFGAVVADAESGEPLILSNNHVLANGNDARAGDPILQPGAADGGKRPEDMIAELERFIPLEYQIEPASCGLALGLAAVANAVARLLGSSHRLQAYQSHPEATNRVDAAVARPTDLEQVRPEVLEIGEIEGTAEVHLGQTVRKSGRTTGFTMGEVVVLDATLVIGYGPSRRARFEGQILTSPMSSPGDSGSLLVAGDSPSAVGLLFAGSDRITVHNPIEMVMSDLGVAF